MPVSGAGATRALPLPPAASHPAATASAAAAEAAAARRRRRRRRLASGDGEIWTAIDAAGPGGPAAGPGVAADAARLPMSPWASASSVGVSLDDFAAAAGYAAAAVPPPPGGPPRAPAPPPPGEGVGGGGVRRLGDPPPAGLLPPAAVPFRGPPPLPLPAAATTAAAAAATAALHVDDDQDFGDGGDERAGLLLPRPRAGGGAPQRPSRPRRRPGAPTKFLLLEPNGRLDLGVDTVAARAGVRRQRAHESAAAALERGTGEVHDLMALLDPGAVVGGASPLLEASFGGGPRPPSLPPPPHNESADGVAATIDGRIGGGSALRSGDTAVLIDTPPVPGDPSPGWSAGATATDGGNGEDAFRQYFWRPDMDGLRPMGEHQAAVLARQEAFIGRLVRLLRLLLAVDAAAWAAYAAHVAGGVLAGRGGGATAAAAVVSALLPLSVGASSATAAAAAAAAPPPPLYVWSHLIIPVATVALDVVGWVVAGSVAHPPLLVLVVALVLWDIVGVVSYEQAALLVRLTLAGVAVQVAGLRSLSRAQAIEFGLEWEREDGVEGYVVVVDAAGTHAAAARLY